MRNTLINILLFVFCLFSASILQAAALPIPKPPATGSKSFIIMDFDSGRVIAEEQPDTAVEPASITKLMSSYVAFRELDSGNISLANDTKAFWQRIDRFPFGQDLHDSPGKIQHAQRHN